MATQYNPDILSRRIPVTDESGTPDLFVKVRLYYDKGGLNVFTYRDERRGYYLSVSPIRMERGMETYKAFSGLKSCVPPVSRKSAKAEANAVALVDEALEDLLPIVCHRNHLTLKEAGGNA